MHSIKCEIYAATRNGWYMLTYLNIMQASWPVEIKACILKHQQCRYLDTQAFSSLRWRARPFVQCQTRLYMILLVAMDPNLDGIRRKYPFVKVIHIFSNGSTTQYRQNGNFVLLRYMLNKRGFTFGKHAVILSWCTSFKDM